MCKDFKKAVFLDVTRNRASLKNVQCFAEERMINIFFKTAHLTAWLSMTFRGIASKKLSRFHLKFYLGAAGVILLSLVCK